MKRLSLFFLLSFFLLCGCQAEHAFPLPVTPSPFLIGLPADLGDQVASTILECARTIPGASLQTYTYSEPYPEPANFNLLIWQGNPAQYPALDTAGLTSFVIGIEEIVLVISPKNNLSSVSITDLRYIFVGKIQDWSGIPQSGLSGPIELWVYYDTHPLRIIFEDVLFGELTISTSALIMPSQAKANELIGKNTNSLSYIRRSQTSANTRILPISGVLVTPTLSVLAIFQDNEESLISPVLDCLLEINIP